MKARCLIVDDESPAREELRFLLGQFDDVEVVGEATTAEEAHVLIRSLRYDVLLLDVRMPGMGGLELARSLSDVAQAPAIIFTTAYPEHAVDAFDLNAADYLLKPFDEVRLRRALDRALDEAEAPTDVGSETSDAHAGPPGAGGTTPGRIPVHQGDSVVLIEEARIVYVEAARGYAYLKLPDGKVLASFTLTDLESRLSDRFLRTHRSFLVNLRHVREVGPDVTGGLTLTMADGSRVPVSRRSAAVVRRRLGL